MGLGNAEKGGILGGFLTGLITILIALLLYSKVDLIADANVPMQKLLQNIHPGFRSLYGHYNFLE